MPQLFNHSKECCEYVNVFFKIVQTILCSCSSDHCNFDRRGAFLRHFLSTPLLQVLWHKCLFTHNQVLEECSNLKEV